MSPAIELRDGGTLLRVRVQPKASRETITATPDAIKIALTAPPVDGQANAALIALLAKHLHLPKSTLHLLSGEKSRDKAIYIPLPPQQVATALGLTPP